MNLDQVHKGPFVEKVHNVGANAVDVSVKTLDGETVVYRINRHSIVDHGHTQPETAQKVVKSGS